MMQRWFRLYLKAQTRKGSLLSGQQRGKKAARQRLREGPRGLALGRKFGPAETDSGKQRDYSVGSFRAFQKQPIAHLPRLPCSLQRQPPQAGKTSEQAYRIGRAALVDRVAFGQEFGLAQAGKDPGRIVKPALSGREQGA